MCWFYLNEGEIPIEAKGIKWDEWIAWFSEERADAGLKIVGENVLAGVGEVFLVDIYRLRWPGGSANANDVGFRGSMVPVAANLHRSRCAHPSNG